MRKVIWLLLISMSSVAYAGDNVPTVDEMQAWWQKNSAEKINFLDQDIRAIHLRNGEVAYLVSISVFDRGRNDFFQTALVRPSLAEVRSLEGTIVKDVADVVDLANDNVSEVIVKSSGSGQGSEMGERGIVQFDGWEPVILREISFSNDSGYIGLDFHSSSDDVTWEFVDLDGDGAKDLVETHVVKEDDVVKSKQINRFVFKDNKFISYTQ
ncbi:MAG TPA: hypothetical protein VNI58_04970 [Mariprofundaceae bacterium]|nr:hypothetical protein [Mariprofundaceae bacterium]